MLTKQATTTHRRDIRKIKCPPVCGARTADDVKLLLEAAIKDGFGKSWSDILNTCAREVLTPIYANKRIRNRQEKLGVIKNG